MSNPDRQIRRDVALTNMDRGSSSVKPRVESAGIFGLTSCTFDAETGELLSTTRQREATLNPVGMLGIPREIIDEEVDCPRRDRYKCQPCPNRKSPPKTLDEPKTVMDPEQLANAQQLHGTIHGFS